MNAAVCGTPRRRSAAIRSDGLVEASTTIAVTSIASTREINDSARARPCWVMVSGPSSAAGVHAPQIPGAVDWTTRIDAARGASTSSPAPIGRMRPALSPRPPATAAIASSGSG